MLCRFSTLLLIATFVFTSLPSVAADVSVYGPELFVRDTAQPLEQQVNIKVANTAVSYRLIIVNGAAGRGRISSAEIRWNGIMIAGPSDFNAKVERLVIPVTALPANTLSVKLKSQPGAGLTIELTRSNQPPTANAGLDQTLYVGDRAQLDGSTSTDSDGDALKYRWRITEVPVGSTAELDNPAAIRPSFPIDMYGHYTAELTVNDGFTDSPADNIAIDTRNSAPVAEAGPDQSAFVGTIVTLDGGASQDVDNNPLTYTWTLVQKPAASSAVITDAGQQQAHFLIDKPGRYSAQDLG